MSQQCQIWHVSGKDGHLKRCMYPNAYSSIIYNRQDMEVT